MLKQCLQTIIHVPWMRLSYSAVVYNGKILPFLQVASYM